VSSNGGFYTYSKLVLFRLLVLIVRDSVITLSAIAYNVNNNLDEVLLAIVCTVHNGNIFNRSRFFLKVNTVEALYPRACGGKDMLKRILKVSILFPYLLLNTVFLCKK